MNKNWVLISGATRGIGLALVSKFMQEGWNVLFISRSSVKISELESLYKASTNLCRGICIDLTEDGEQNLLQDEVSKYTSSIKALVNGLGGVAGSFGNFESLDVMEWKNIYNINVLSSIRLTKAVLGLLDKNSNIVFLSSLAGKRPGRYNPHYGSSKAAIIHLSKYLSQSLAKDFIKVNCICPSTLDDETFKDDIRDMASRNSISYEAAEKVLLNDVMQKSLLKKLGTPDEISELIFYICSNRTPTLTGACLTVDGGQSQSLF